MAISVCITCKSFFIAVVRFFFFPVVNEALSGGPVLFLFLYGGFSDRVANRKRLSTDKPVALRFFFSVLVCTGTSDTR